MTENQNYLIKSGLIGTLLALVVVIIIMVALTFTIFNGIWQFWMFFPIMGVSIAVLATGIYYLYYKTR